MDGEPEKSGQSTFSSGSAEKASMVVREVFFGEVLKRSRELFDFGHEINRASRQAMYYEEIFDGGVCCILRVLGV